MLKHIENFKKAKVLVVGDAIIDRYWQGNTNRISPEAPVAIVKMAQDELRAGGAANVAMNIASLGGQVTLLAHVGDDLDTKVLINNLNNNNVKTNLVTHKDYKTIHKIRVLSKAQQLIRLDFEENLSETQAEKLLPIYEAELVNYDVVILSDYGKGCIQIADKLIAKAREFNIPVLVDPKTSDFADYKGATVITPNTREFSLVVGGFSNLQDLHTKAQGEMQQNDIASILVTRGSEGMSLCELGQNTLHIPTKAKEVYDVTGAGDTVIAVLGLALASGAPLALAAQMANHAAGIVVGKLGTSTVNAKELANSAFSDGKLLAKGIVSQKECLEIRRMLKTQDKKVVMTNGCFDLLHPGHIHYLQQAKELGDVLIVAVNTDDSVKRLKGNSRPINKLEDRMAMLSALKMVDVVVAFEEDTPEELYNIILPDILVKGGDYKVEEVAGNKAILAAGGEVIILDFVAGYSSSKIIAKIEANQLEVS